MAEGAIELICAGNLLIGSIKVKWPIDAGYKHAGYGRNVWTTTIPGGGQG